MDRLRESFLELIGETSVRLPEDVRAVMELPGLMGRANAADGGEATMTVLARNIGLAAARRRPLCQDTGMPTFWIAAPKNADRAAIERDVRDAVAEATRQGLLRPNSVDATTGRNTGDNLSPTTPIVHWRTSETGRLRADLLLKGGGCENVGAQYSLPCELKRLGTASRDREGVRRCVLDAVWRAQGLGCAPGVVGVAVGGDRATGYAHAKRQLLRDLRDTHPDPDWADLEKTLVEAANRLGIGPMGLGGAPTLLACKIGALHRIPASFFVSVAYNCWALRRLGVNLDVATGAICAWHLRGDTDAPLTVAAEAPSGGKATQLTLPIAESDARRLRVGDLVRLSGRIVTGRDAVHRHLMTHRSPAPLDGGLIYHCGPIMVREGEGWRVAAAGPTTSMREEPYQADLIRKFGLRAVLGKGGMGERTRSALRECGAVYLHAVGGAAQVYAETIRRVSAVHWLDEFGVPEAMWELEVEGLPAVVTMDSHGGSLHDEIAESSARRLAESR